MVAKSVCSIVMVVVAAGASAGAWSPVLRAQSQASGLVAIDVALQPAQDALMQLQAAASRLLKENNLPQSHTIEFEPAPRITLVQRFVRAADVPAISAALDKVVAGTLTQPVRLTAMGYASVDWADKTVVVATIEPSADVDRLARRVVDAVQPFAASGGTAAAFVRLPGEEITPAGIRLVEEFVPKSSGNNFTPVLKLGTAHPEFVKVLGQASFDRLRFTGATLAMYQLGRLGSAQKRLWGSQIGGK